MRVVFTLLLLIFLSAQAPAGRLDPETINTVVLIARDDGNQLFIHGSGILFLVNEPHQMVVVTAKHVLEQHQALHVSVAVDSGFLRTRKTQVATPDGRFWKLLGKRLYTRVELLQGDGTLRYVAHPDSTLDIAAFPISIPASINGIAVTQALGVGSSSVRLKRDVTYGDDTYFIGFNGVPGQDLAPLLRTGAVAWLSDRLLLLDAVTLEGNSGAPVFTQPYIDPATRNSVPSYLVGMVIGYFSKRLGVVEIKNLNLTRAVWADDLLVVAEAAAKLSLIDTRAAR